jgi:hypothetical protein
MGHLSRLQSVMEGAMEVQAQVCPIFQGRQQSPTDMVEYIALPITLEYVTTLS